MTPRRRASAVTLHLAADGSRHLLAIRQRDPGRGGAFWSVPGGAVEEGETAPAAAVRETLEETGYRVDVLDAPPVVNAYRFEWNGRLYDCHTCWVPCRVVPTATPAQLPAAAFTDGELLDPAAPVADARLPGAETDPGIVTARWLPERLVEVAFGTYPFIVDPIRQLLASTRAPQGTTGRRITDG
ncbi:MAG: NUDIX domain-containing protein [Pseudomonadales bacterium]|jgi:8-oxo-dGTP pyrophosphatase MutT (NUDIX family)|nr:NUDIX domain-containing protein [Pseudomonadales bacterium]